MLKEIENKTTSDIKLQNTYFKGQFVFKIFTKLKSIVCFLFRRIIGAILIAGCEWKIENYYYLSDDNPGCLLGNLISFVATFSFWCVFF